jgi:SAM-dependent methyltransferase
MENSERAAAWESAGSHRVKHADQDDAEARPHNERFRAATGVGPGDRVLDVGCGTGQSTREAARAATPGSVLGVDISATMLERARLLSEREGLGNVTYEHADAQAHGFAPERFDIALSRFGAMFFADPVAAFTNIGRALRPGGRLVLLVWQGWDRNEWATAVHEALAPGKAPPDQPLPFSLADPATVDGILTAAGFDHIEFTEVREPVYYGQDSEAAFSFVRGLRSTNDLLAGLDPAAAAAALDRLRATLSGHDDTGGVFFDSRAWIISADRHSGHLGGDGSAVPQHR